MIIGIDPGLNGGLCYMEAGTGKIIMLQKPRITSHAGKKEWCATWLADSLDEANESAITNTVVIMEDCGYHYKQSSAMRSAAYCCGIITGACGALCLPLIRVRPRQWQAAVIGKIPKGKTKEYAITTANNIWPAQDFLRSKRCRKADDGLVDAALIAYYAHLAGKSPATTKTPNP